MHPSFSYKRPLGLLALALSAVTLSAHQAEAAKVTTIKGKSVMIEMDADELQQGEKYFVFVDGKKKAVVQIAKTKGTKAIGKVLKGNPVEGGSVGKDSGSASASSGGGKRKKSSGSMSADSGDSGGDASVPGLFIGVLGGMGMDSQTVKDASNGNQVSMSGSGFSVKAYADMPIAGGFGVIGRAGIEQMNLAGSLNGNNYETKIMYATADAMARYSFTDGGFVPFVAGGAALHFPLSKSSNILDVPRISSTSIFIFAGGAHYHLSDTMIITAMAEYDMFLPSNDVTTSIIAVRAGAAFKF